MQTRSVLCTALCLATGLAHAAEFRTGQAARAVIGQPSFTAHDAGIQAQSLAYSNGQLYVADAGGHVLTFDHLPGVLDEVTNQSQTSCVVCGFSPHLIINQLVSPSAAVYSSFGRAVAMVDTVNHRVLLWRDNQSASAAYGPDVIFEADTSSRSTSNSTLLDPVSVALDGKRLFVGDKALHRVLIWNSLPTDSRQGADVVLGQPSFNNVDVADTGPDRFADPQALVSDGTNLYVADGGSRRILVFSPSDLALTQGAVTNSANFKSGPLAPGTLITIKGQRLTQTSESAIDDGEHDLPFVLGGVEVMLDGHRLPLISVSPSQIQAQLPYNQENGTTSSLYIRARSPDGAITTTNAIAVQSVPASPGIFAAAGAEPRAGLLLHSSVSGSSQETPVTTDNPAKPGEVLTAWATGLGHVTAMDFGKVVEAGQPYSAYDSETQIPVEAYVNGQSVPVIHAGLAKGTIGVYEVRILLPSNLSAAHKANLLVSQAGVNSNTIMFSIENTIH